MGILLSTEERKMIKRAKEVRKSLYQNVQQAKKRYQQAFMQISQEQKTRISRASASQIADMLDEGQTTSIQVLFVFMERVCTVGVEGNYVIELLFENALRIGEQCDNQRKKDNYKKKVWKPGKKLDECYPPFYGVPTSVKESILMKGCQSYCGTVAMNNPIPQEESAFMLLVKKMGFIPFVRSNVPQVCRTLQTNNNMFGYCLNPWDKKRSCGGSSGGESGVVASFCSPFGIGTDLAGSIRIPAQFTGLCALKHARRFSSKGNFLYGKYNEGLPIRGQLGPIARSTQDLLLFQQFMSNPLNYADIPPHLLDPYIHPHPFNFQYYFQSPKLNVGVVQHLPTIKTSQPNLRALKQCEQILRKKGHKMVQVFLPNFEELSMFMLLSTMSDQRLALVKQVTKSQPLIKEYWMLELIFRIPWLIRRIIIWMIKKREPRVARILRAMRPVSSREFVEETGQAKVTLANKIYEVFVRSDIDALIMPTFVCPAPRIGEVHKLNYCFAYTASWNTICYPSGVVPVTVVKGNESTYTDDYNDTYSKQVRRSLEGSEGLPIGVQVVSKPFNEEKILYLMSEIEKSVNFRTKHKPNC